MSRVRCPGGGQEQEYDRQGEDSVEEGGVAGGENAREKAGSRNGRQDSGNEEKDSR